MNSIIDMSSFEPRAQRALILALFDGLKSNESFEAVFDHNPETMCKDLQAIQSSNLKLGTAMLNPKQWSIQLKKVAGDSCCGVCGGH